MSEVQVGGCTELGLPSLADIFWQFLQIGAISFGGGIVAYERILLIEKRRWLTEDQFMAYLAISQTMPGLNSVNLAVLAGDALRGAWGAISAVLGLILPGSLFILIIGVAYLQNADHPLANMVLVGIAAAACGLLAAITYRIGGDHWRHPKSFMIILLTFLLMSVVKLSLPIVLLLMAPVSIYLYRPSSAP